MSTLLHPANHQTIIEYFLVTVKIFLGLRWNLCQSWSNFCWVSVEILALSPRIICQSQLKNISVLVEIFVIRGRIFCWSSLKFLSLYVNIFFQSWLKMFSLMYVKYNFRLFILGRIIDMIRKYYDKKPE